MGTLSRLNDSEMEDGNTIYADDLDEEFDQIITESNAQDGRLDTLETLNKGAVSSDPGSPSDGNLWYNTTTDEFKGQIDGAVTVLNTPTGVISSYIAATAPSGWVQLAGKTIGNASSGGTERANADCEALFELLWTEFADAEAPVSSGRGASAQADFDANKTITLPDLRGRAIVGLDDMGGSSASRITASSTDGGNASTPGGAGGAETHTLTEAELASHKHFDTSAGAVFTANSVTADGISNTGSGATAFSGAISLSKITQDTIGSDTAHSNTQPWLALYYIMKL